MAENPVTFSPDAARRIIRAVKVVEQGGVTGPQHRRASSDRPDIFRWFGVVGVKSGSQYTVTSCTFNDGSPTLIGEGEYGYISKLCTPIGAPVAPIGSVVQVYEAWNVSALEPYPVFYTGPAPAEITSAAVVTAATRWTYSITFGAYTEAGVWEVGEDTSTAVNTIEANNTSGTVTGGDGVTLPPAVGTLTRLPVATGAVVMVTPVAPNLYAFTVPNPFGTSCDE